MAFARPWWSQKERVFAVGDEPSGGQLVDQRAIHLPVEIEVEGIERAIGIAEAGLFVAAREESVFATQELVGHQQRDEIDGREFLRLRLAQPRFEDGRHAGEAEFPERMIEFDEIHCDSPVLRSMRSR